MSGAQTNNKIPAPEAPKKEEPKKESPKPSEGKSGNKEDLGSHLINNITKDSSEKVQELVK